MRRGHRKISKELKSGRKQIGQLHRELAASEHSLQVSATLVDHFTGVLSTRRYRLAHWLGRRLRLSLEINDALWSRIMTRSSSSETLK